METNQIILESLQKQLETKIEECKLYEKDIYIPAIRKIDEEINKVFKHQFKFHKVKLNTNNFTIHHEDEEVREISISIFNPWDKENKLSLSLGYYSTTIHPDSDIDIKYITLVSKVANNFCTIESIIVNDFYPLVREEEKKYNRIFYEVEKIKTAIRDIENKILEEEKSKYSQVGFKIKFKPEVTFDHNSIRYFDKKIKIDLSSKKWDTLRVGGYEILAKPKTKNKYLVELWFDNDIKHTYSIPPRQFDEFIYDVFKWETQTAIKQEERANNEYQEYINSLQVGEAK